MWRLDLDLILRLLCEYLVDNVPFPDRDDAADSTRVPLVLI